MADATANAVIKVKADTAQARSELKSLIGTISGVASGMGKIAAGMAVVAGGIATALHEAERAVTLVNIEKRLPTGALKALTEATGNSVAKSDLLRIAFNRLQGSGALTVMQLTTMAKVAAKLNSEGFGPVDDLLRELSEKFREGPNQWAKSLEKYGIKVNRVKDEHVTLQKAWAELHRLAAMPLEVDPMLNAIGQVKTEVLNATDEIRKRLGLVASEWAQNVALMFNWVNDTGRKFEDRSIETAAESVGAKYGLDANQRLRLQATASGTPDLYRQIEVALEQGIPDSVIREFDREVKRLQKEIAKLKNRPGFAPIAPTPLSGTTGTTTDSSKRKRKFEESLDDYELNEFIADAIARGRAVAAEFKKRDAADDIDLIINRGMVEQGTRALAVKEELDKESADKAKLKLAEDLNKAQEMSNYLLGAPLADAISAAISGQEGFAKAFRRAAGARLQAVGIEQSVMAGVHTAAAIGLLIWNPGAAGTEFAAAGSAAAAAAAAFAGSALLGGGGGSASVPRGAGSSPGGGFVSAPRGTTSGGNSTVVINVGQGFVGDPKTLGEEITKAIKRSDRTGRGHGNAVTIGG